MAPAVMCLDFVITCHSPVLYGVDVEIDEPVEGVLVHGVNVGQIRNAEEEDGRVLGDRPVALSRFSYFDLRLLSYLNLREIIIIGKVRANRN